MMKRWVILAFAFFAAHFSVASDTPDPARLFSDLEDNLLKKEVSLDFQITSEGAVVSSVKGTLKVHPDNVIEWDVSGTFNDTPVSIHLTSDGEYLKENTGSDKMDVVAPAFLNEGILIGLTRMGLLHNIIMMASRATPDGVDGTIRDFVKVTDFKGVTLEEHEGKKTRRLEFKITAKGKPVAEAVLWLDAKTGLPVHRTQTVHFEKEDMNVVERYQFH